MEKKSSPPSDPQTASPPSPSSPPSDYQTDECFASNFTTLFHSIFPPKPPPLPASLSQSPSTSSPSSATATTTTTEDMSTKHCLRQARLILEYQQLFDHYLISVARLQSLRQENADLRLANGELAKILNISYKAAAIQNHLISNQDMTIPTKSNRFDRGNMERVALPKTISVRSTNYIQAAKINGGTPGTTNASTRPRLSSLLDQHVSGSVQRKVYVAAGGGVGVEGKRCSDDVAGAAAVEFGVYNQGTWKTELCNKWEEIGACPYGDRCRFAHGIRELRPIMRHPRYKTQACRMVLSGDVCPYGRRCHFRHSLTDQERPSKKNLRGKYRKTVSSLHKKREKGRALMDLNQSIKFNSSSTSSPQVRHFIFPNHQTTEEARYYSFMQLQKQNLEVFWNQQLLEISNTTVLMNNHQLPLARIKRIMKSGGAVKMVSSDTPVLFSKAIELFILELTLRAWLQAEECKRSTVQRYDIIRAIRHDRTLDFLVDATPFKRKDEKIGGHREIGCVPEVPLPFPMMDLNKDWLEKNDVITRDFMVKQSTTPSTGCGYESSSK